MFGPENGRSKAGERVQPEVSTAMASTAKAGTGRARRLRLSVSLAALLVLCGAWAAVQHPARQQADSVPVDITARSVPLNKNDPGQSRIGALAYLGGVQLLSEANGFGGYSGLRQLPDGRMLAISDRGHWLVFRPVERQGRLTEVADAIQGPLLDETGQPLEYPYFDAEALEVVTTPEGGLDVFVAFEQRHRVWRYARRVPAPVLVGVEENGQAAQDPPSYLEQVKQAFAHRPESLPWMDGWPGQLGANAGLEAMAVEADGAALLLAEGTGEGRFRPHADAPWIPIRYRTEAGFKPTDSVFLPIEGRHLALVINRYFSILHGVAARLELVDLDAVKDGQVTGRLLARLTPPVTVDNMEALEVVPHPEGGWSVWLMADDNQNPLQRTLLLKFHLPESAVLR